MGVVFVYNEAGAKCFAAGDVGTLAYSVVVVVGVVVVVAAAVAVIVGVVVVVVVVVVVAFAGDYQTVLQTVSYVF